MDKIRAYKLENITFWVGAGISSDNPSGLPLGNGLSEFTIQNVFLQPSILMEIWAKISKIIENPEIYALYPRLESILASCSFIEKSIDDHSSFLSGFKAFNDREFNRIHLLLACLMKFGANIMTANFDLCIEKAYTSYFHETLYKHQDRDGSIFYETSKGNKIIHFHGTTSKLYDMKMTLDNLMLGISKKIWN